MLQCTSLNILLRLHHNYVSYIEPLMRIGLIPGESRGQIFSLTVSMPEELLQTPAHLMLHLPIEIVSLI